MKNKKRVLDIDLIANKEIFSQLNQLVGGSPIPTFVLNKKHKVVYWNKACEKMSGLKEKDMVGTKKQWKAFYKKSRPVMADLIVDQGTEKNIDKFYSKDGKSFFQKSKLIKGAYEATDFFPHLGKKGLWLFFTAAPIKDNQGNIVGAIETLQDITKQKEAEISLQSSEENYRNLAERANDGIIIVQDHKIKYVNLQMTKMLGRSSKSIINKSFFSCIHPSERKSVMQRCKVHAAEQKSKCIYETILLKNGKEKVDVELNAGRIEFDNRPADLIIVRDITQRKKYIEKIKEGEYRWNSFTDNSNDLIQVFDLKGRIKYINWVFPFDKKEEVIGTYSSKYVEKDYRDKYKKTIAKTIKTKKI